ncbi:DUF1059 domain-containing protein [Capillimicrobium parvum]|uniref:DUF1059 domain-containing protein n=1 Tax=Capillimicrobium parvum TaxID=2884022 RepID=A0A9E6XT54_9ACTN|nr:DUF1059 domain-containing protein [Capillimicrobium parvum]UGS33668.1 hypothetical protein DSM104329_00033 [Capillimicrobium parvum]
MTNEPSEAALDENSPKEVVCPVCGGIVEGETLTELLEIADEHTRQAHGYSVPPEHVRAAAYDAVR